MEGRGGWKGEEGGREEGGKGRGGGKGEEGGREEGGKGEEGEVVL